jgi:CheY-like chemotaxis protein
MPVPPDPSPAPRPAAYVLLVEPDAAAAAVTLGALGEAGYTVSVVPSGAQALVITASLSFDVLVAALDPPDLPGRAAVGAAPRAVPGLWAVALLRPGRGHGRLPAAGFDAAVVRPVRPAALLAAVVRRPGQPGRPEDVRG